MHKSKLQNNSGFSIHYCVNECNMTKREKHVCLPAGSATPARQPPPGTAAAAPSRSSSASSASSGSEVLCLAAQPEPTRKANRWNRNPRPGGEAVEAVEAPDPDGDAAEVAPWSSRKALSSHV